MSNGSLSDLERTTRDFRTALLRNDRAAASVLVNAYKPMQAKLVPQIEELSAAISEMTPPTPAAIRRLDRYRALLRQTETEMQRLGVLTGQQAEIGATSAANLAADQALALMDAAIGPRPPSVSYTFNRLPKAALQEFAGALQSDSPLTKLLDGFGAEASKRLQDALFQGVALGEGPRALADRMRVDLGGNAVRALVIVRDTTLGVSRRASLATYQANGDVCEGWTWHSALSDRTCAVCFALHGQVFGLDVPFFSHNGCRCAAIPRTKSWAELGFSGIPDTRPEIPDGADVFAGLDEGVQRQILGPGKYSLYQSGKLGLSDLVAETNSGVWGPGRRVRTLAEVV